MSAVGSTFYVIGSVGCNFQCLDDVRTHRLYRRECLHWCVPDVEGTSVEPRGGGHQHLDPDVGIEGSRVGP